MANEKIAVVTGATGSLGSAVTKGLLTQGIHVIVTYRTEGSLAGLRDEIGTEADKIEPRKADVTDEKDVAELFDAVRQQHGRVDILINNVGAYSGGKEIWNTPVKEWDDMLIVNLRSAFLCCRAALPMMVEQNYGKIVNIAARPALEKRYRAKSGAYSVSKAGVLVLTETIAEEVRKLDINVNAVLPSTIDTPENRKAMPQADFSKWVPPAEIAMVIMGLVSDNMRPVSGSAVTVYGKA
ncbi:MAG TPA: SDR family NAD(P)-dependent oxidoreductase [Methanomassiliicoccales archaeon]|jgi:NAD(P)-dependent dehydrogenase (short-subunit alcohol dehydrogenase family)